MSQRNALPVIAVSGGLAGAAFALELARNGRRVIVLERTRGPHHKVCGEFVSEEGQGVLSSFGLDVGALGASSIVRFRLIKGERHATAPLPFTAAGISRCRLDEAMLAAAEGCGATVIRGATVTGIEPRDGGVVVQTEKRVWRAAAVGLATGKHALRGVSRPAGGMVGFKQHLQANAAAQQLAGLVQLVFFRGGYAGACLVEEGILSIAWVLQKQLVRSVGADWSAQGEHLARQSSIFGDLLAGSRPLLPKPVAIAALAYGFLRSKPVAPNVFPVGDQFAVVPSFAGDGVTIALNSGRAAADALLAGRPAETFHHDLAARLQPQLRLAGAVGWLLETPITCAISIAAARLFPGLVTCVAAATRSKASAQVPQRPCRGPEWGRSTPF